MTKFNTKCPGLYCGRQLLANGNWSDCGACPRGFRTNATSICVPCNDKPVFYDWLYLGFMTLLPLVFHWFCIDSVSPLIGSNKSVLVIHFSALLEVMFAALLTVWLADPIGRLEFRSCQVNQLSDWYTLFHNPTPNYEETIHCTQEAVYPLYTIVLIFYAMGIAIMLIIRPCLTHFFLPKVGKVTIYSALYFYPILMLLQAVLGGVIYYTFPYIVIILSVISIAAHFAYKLGQTMLFLILSSVSDLRSVLILLGHWALHAYGIIALTQLTDPVFHISLMALVPLPAVFYILTARFTDPNKLHTE